MKITKKTKDKIQKYYAWIVSIMGAGSILIALFVPVSIQILTYLINIILLSIALMLAFPFIFSAIKVK